MKRYYLYLIAFFALAFNIAYGQTPPAAGAAAAPANTTNNGDVIMLNFSGGNASLDKHFPFDKWFTIHLTNIPATFDKVDIKLQTGADIIAAYKSKSKTDDTPGDVILGTWTRDPNASPVQTSGDIVIASYLKYNTDFLVKITSYITKPIPADRIPALSVRLAADPDIGAIVEKMGKVSAIDAPTILVDYKAEIIAVLKKSLQKINAGYNFKEPNAIPVIEILRAFRQDMFNVTDPIDAIELQTTQTGAQKESLRKAVNAINWGSLQVGSPQYVALKNTINALKASEPADNPALAVVKAQLDLVANAIDPAIAKRNELIKALVDRVALTDAYEASAVSSSYDHNFVASAGSYVTLDIGLPYVSRIDRVIMYSGINIYSRPIDKSIPLESYRGWDKFRIRASFLLGVSLASVEKEGQRKGLIGTNALVLGLGYRVLPFLKLTAGTFCHYRYDNNPLIDASRYHFSTSPFIGLSIDADVKQLFSAFGTPFQ